MSLPVLQKRRARASGGLGEILLPEISGLQMTHTTQVDVSPKDTVSLSGVIVSRNMRGGGYIVAAYNRRLNENVWFQIDTAMGSTSFVNAKVGGQLSRTVYYNVGANFGTWPWNRPPSLEFTLGRALGRYTTGYMTYRTGDWSWTADDGISFENDSFELGIQRTVARRRFNASVDVGLRASSLQFKYSHPVSKASAVNLNAAFSTSEGIVVGLGAERSLFSAHNRIGAAVECNTAMGVSLKVKVSRLGQTLSVPILIAESITIRSIVLASAIPTMTALAVQRLFLNARWARLRKARLDQIKERTHEEMLCNRREAEEAIALMQASVEKKREQEERSEGLVVLDALYGDLQHPEDACIDVTIPVQMLVHQSQLNLAEGSSKSALMGFYDPCPWCERKQLRIRYQYRGRLHEVTLDDYDGVSCPMRSHVVGA